MLFNPSHGKGVRLLELVSHLSALKADRKKLDEHLDYFVSKFVYPKLRGCNPVYITAPFWSQIEVDPDGGEPGYWYDATCYISKKEAEAILPSYAVFFACILNSQLVPFSMARLVSPQMVHKIPLVIDIHRKAGRGGGRCWPRFDLVSFYELSGHRAAGRRRIDSINLPKHTPVRLRIESPYLPELKLGCGEWDAVEVWRLDTEDSLYEERLLTKLPFQQFKDNTGLAARLRAIRVERLREVFGGEEFRAYCDRLLADCTREEFKERLLLHEWGRREVEGLARFLVSYNILAGEWRYAYHLPSKVSKEVGREAEEDVGSGGPIFATKSAVPERRLAEMSLGTNLEFRSLALDDHRRKAVDDVKREARRSALAAIMSRNMSHNIGSHVLASSDLLDGVHKVEIQKFHGFLQQRMDFIAQVVTYTPAWGEPMFFFKDVLQGFFNQYLLLGHLIKDQGYRAIKFVVEYGGGQWVFAREEEERCRNEGCNRVRGAATEEGWCQCTPQVFVKGGRWVLQGAKQPGDFLVAIPGGNTGVHALYDILENILRNSAKYGKHPAEEAEFRLRIAVEESVDNYLLSVRDNVSDAGDCSGGAASCSCRVCKVQSNLKMELIPDTGGEADEIQSHGVNEMKECARILAYPHESKEPGWNARAGGRNGGQAHFWADGSGGRLTHKFFVQKPRLAGIVDLSGALSYGDCDEARRAGVYCYTRLKDLKDFEDLKDLAAHSHQLGAIIMPAGREEADKVFAWIKEKHYLLPYRLLVFADDAGGRLREAADLNLPPRRIRWCGLEELPRLEGGNSRSWEDLVVGLYELWVKKFKGLGAGAKRRLVIAFDRAESSIFEQWRRALEPFRRGFDSELVEVDILQTVKGGDGNRDVRLISSSSAGLTEDELFRTIHERPETIFLFDNHNKALKGIGRYRPESSSPVTTRKLGFYHQFGEGNLKLFQSLTTPPLQPFAVRLFALSLLEGALTNVLIVDERVAEATFSRSKGFEALLKSLKAVKCFPVYFIWTATGERTSLSDELDVRDDLFRAKQRGITHTISKDEGLHIEDDAPRVEVQEATDKTWTTGADFFDFIIIHQGVIDRLKEAGRWDIGKHLERLYRLAPSVVITSGRGRTLRHVPLQIPFLEFSALRENTYPATAISKYHLARTLFSVSGR